MSMYIYSFCHRYNALNVVPAAMGKKVRDIASKVNCLGHLFYYLLPIVLMCSQLHTCIHV